MKVIASYCDHTTGRLTVLTVGTIGDYAAYEGDNISMLGGIQHVANTGNKISRERAESLFADFVTSTAVYRL